MADGEPAALGAAANRASADQRDSRQSGPSASGHGRNARDLGLFVRLFGFSPVEALHAATAVGGELLDRSDEIGRIAPGYLADLLVVRGDPTGDVTLLEDKENLLAIMKDGSFHKVSDALVQAGKASALW